MTLAWAIPVKTQLLGARLEAYVESKLLVATFKLCVKYGPSNHAPVGRLPPELINLIVDRIQWPILNSCESRWARYQLCLEDKCSTYDHFTEEQICDNEFYPHNDVEDEYEDDRYEHFMDLEWKLGCTHEIILREHLEKFKALSGDQSEACKAFARCKEVRLLRQKSRDT